MIFFLHGADDYRRVERKKALILELKKKYPDITEARFLLGEDRAVEKFMDFAGGQSLFSSKRLAVLEDAFAAEPKQLAEILERFAEAKDVAVVVCEGGKILKQFSFLLKKPVHSEEFENLAGQEYLKFAAQIAKKEGLQIEPRALSLLAGAYTKNSWGLVAEIEKLALSGKKITVEGAEDLGFETELEYFPLLNSLKSSALKTRLWALYKLGGDDPAKTFNILSSLSKPKAQTFAGYDLSIKSGKMEYGEALLDFALS